MSSPFYPLPKAITFDAADTLFELAEPVGRTYARFAQQAGLFISANKLQAGFFGAWKSAPAMTPGASGGERRWWCNLVHKTFHLALKPSNPAEWESIAAAIDGQIFDQLFAHYAKGEAWRLFPDTWSTLDGLHRHFPLGVVSNFDIRLHSILADLKLCHFFEAVITSDELGYRKPEPRIFIAACKALQVNPASLLHVGDDAECDQKGALQAGCRSFRIVAGHTHLRDLLAICPGTANS